MKPELIQTLYGEFLRQVDDCVQNRDSLARDQLEAFVCIKTSGTTIYTYVGDPIHCTDDDYWTQWYTVVRTRAEFAVQWVLSVSHGANRARLREELPHARIRRELTKKWHGMFNWLED